MVLETEMCEASPCWERGKVIPAMREHLVMCPPVQFAVLFPLVYSPREQVLPPLTQKHEELRLYSPCGHSHLGAEVSGAQDTEHLSGFEQGCPGDLRAPSKGGASPGAAFHTLQFGGCSGSLGRLGICFPCSGV